MNQQERDKITFNQLEQFEKAASDLLEDGNDTENVIESYGDDSLIIDFQNNVKMCTVSLCRKKWINYLEECAKKYPEEVQIRYRNTNGSIVAYMPISYLRIRRPREITEEQREIMRQRAYNFLNTDSSRQE